MVTLNLRIKTSIDFIEILAPSWFRSIFQSRRRLTFQRCSFEYHTAQQWRPWLVFQRCSFQHHAAQLSRFRLTWWRCQFNTADLDSCFRDAHSNWSRLHHTAQLLRFRLTWWRSFLNKVPSKYLPTVFLFRVTSWRNHAPSCHMKVGFQKILDTSETYSGHFAFSGTGSVVEACCARRQCGKSLRISWNDVGAGYQYAREHCCRWGCQISSWGRLLDKHDLLRLESWRSMVQLTNISIQSLLADAEDVKFPLEAYCLASMISHGVRAGNQQAGEYRNWKDAKSVADLLFLREFIKRIYSYTIDESAADHDAWQLSTCRLSILWC